MAPTSIELLVRRLSWWQQIVTEPNHHSHFLAAFFGQCTFELTVGQGQVAPSIADNGTLSTAPSTHPWLRQLRDDLA
eukprot:3149162-Pyramimonas_sp.AAC.1